MRHQEHPRAGCQAGEGSLVRAAEDRGHGGDSASQDGQVPRLVLTPRFMPRPISTPGALSWVNKSTMVASKAV